MIVRQFEKSDARECCGVISACITSMPHLDAPTRFYLQSKNVPSDFYNDIKGDYALVAELHGQIVGVGALRANEIHRVYVSPDYQGIGIGETLMVALEAEAHSRGVEIIQIESEPNSVEFYEHLGYKNIGTTYAKVGFSTIEISRMSKKVVKPASV